MCCAARQAGVERYHCYAGTFVHRSRWLYVGGVPALLETMRYASSATVVPTWPDRLNESL